MTSLHRTGLRLSRPPHVYMVQLRVTRVVIAVLVYKITICWTDLWLMLSSLFRQCYISISINTYMNSGFQTTKSVTACLTVAINRNCQLIFYDQSPFNAYILKHVHYMTSFIPNWLHATLINCKRKMYISSDCFFILYIHMLTRSLTRRKHVATAQ